MGKKAYASYLASKVWKNRKKQQLNKSDRCFMCGRKVNLHEWGWTVLRFTDDQVKDNIDGCMEHITSFPETHKNKKESKRALRELNCGIMQLL